VRAFSDLSDLTVLPYSFYCEIMLENYNVMDHSSIGGDSVINVGGPGYLSPSFNPPFFASLLWTPQGYGQSPLTHFQIFWCNLYSKQESLAIAKMTARCALCIPRSNSP